MKKSLLLLVFFFLVPTTHALTLDEYGVSFYDNGLIDHVTGLRWVDSGLTDGGLDELQDWLDAGWRIATEEEFFFLVSRQNAQFGGPADVPLHLDDFRSMMQRLSVDEYAGGAFGGPWLCRDYGDPDLYCSSTTSFGGGFLIDSLEFDPDSEILHFYMAVYLSEVPMYGSLECYKFPETCDYRGRSLMVRATPLPGAVVLLFSGLSVLLGFAGRSRQSVAAAHRLD